MQPFILLTAGKGGHNVFYKDRVGGQESHQLYGHGSVRIYPQGHLAGEGETGQRRGKKEGGRIRVTHWDTANKGGQLLIIHCNGRLNRVRMSVFCILQGIVVFGGEGDYFGLRLVFQSEEGLVGKPLETTAKKGGAGDETQRQWIIRRNKGRGQDAGSPHQGGQLTFNLNLVGLIGGPQTGAIRASRPFDHQQGRPTVA